MKHQVGCAWNEQSAHDTPRLKRAFYPEHFRLQDSKNKQGSSGCLDDNREDEALTLLARGYQVAYYNYLRLLDMGVCREQARMILPVGIYSECIWSASTQAIMHFFKACRMDSHSQFEMQEFAKLYILLRLVSFLKLWSLSMQCSRCHNEIKSTLAGSSMSTTIARVVEQYLIRMQSSSPTMIFLMMRVGMISPKTRTKMNSFFDVCWLVMGMIFNPNQVKQDLGWEKILAKSIPSRMRACQQVASTAERMGVDPNLMIAIAYESNT